MHLRMCELARDYLQKTNRFRVVAGILSPVSDHYGKEGLESAHHRYAMVSRALASPNPNGAASWLMVDDWESRQEKWTPTRQVLDHYQAVLKKALEQQADPPPSKKHKPDCAALGFLAERTLAISKLHGVQQMESGRWNIRLVCGSDVLLSFGRPGVWLEDDMRAICRDYGLNVIGRPGYDAANFVYENDLINSYQHNIHLVTEWSVNEISSTKVRRALRRNESVRYLVPDATLEYIRQQGLYTPPASRMKE